MVWHLIKPILHFLSKPYRTAALELANKETGLNGVDDSWKNCVTKTDSVLGYGTGHLFVREAESQGNYDEKKVMVQFTSRHLFPLKDNLHDF